MTEEQRLKLSSAYGDGWFDGFLAAKKLDEDKDFYLEDVEEGEVLKLSEHAEAEIEFSINKGKAK